MEDKDFTNNKAKPPGSIKRANLSSKLNAFADMSSDEFAKLRALRAFAPYAPSCFTRLRALVPSRLTCLICYLLALPTRDIKSLIKGNFKYLYIYMMYIYMMYIYI